MTGVKSRYGKSLLSYGKSLFSRSNDGSETIEPWFRDPEKLVRAALDRDTDRRRALIAGLVDLASTDEVFRRQMFDKFGALGKGKKSRLSMPFWQQIMLVDHVEYLKAQFSKENKPHSITDVCASISHLFNMSSKRVEALYYQFKKDPDVIKALNR